MLYRCFDIAHNVVAESAVFDEFSLDNNSTRLVAANSRKICQMIFYLCTPGIVRCREEQPDLAVTDSGCQSAQFLARNAAGRVFILSPERNRRLSTTEMGICKEINPPVRSTLLSPLVGVSPTSLNAGR